MFFRVVETRGKFASNEIAWEHEYEVRVFPRNSEFLANFHKCFYNSIGCFLKNVLYFLYYSLFSRLNSIKTVFFLSIYTKHCLLINIVVAPNIFPHSRLRGL